MQGYNPATAIEFGRKVLFSTDRPTFSELEGHVKGKNKRIAHYATWQKNFNPSSSSASRRARHAAHGGAWKIAYADFVTAMMAFFLLMWLLGSTAKGELQGISDYFSSPLKVAMAGGDGSGQQLQRHPGWGQRPFESARAGATL